MKKIFLLTVLLACIVAAVVGIPVTAVAQPANTSAVATPSVRAATDEPVNYFKWVDNLERRLRSHPDTEMPQGVAFILAGFMFAGLGTGIWYLFGRGSCEEFFDDLAGHYVAGGNWFRFLRPMGLFMVIAFWGNLTGNLWVGVAGGGAYEAVILAFRAHRYGSFRAAAVEALFLGLMCVAFFGLMALFIVFFFLAAGATRRNTSSGKRYAECKDCKHYVWQSTVCERGYRQDGTCSEFQ